MSNATTSTEASDVWQAIYRQNQDLFLQAERLPESERALINEAISHRTEAGLHSHNEQGKRSWEDYQQALVTAAANISSPKGKAFLKANAATLAAGTKGNMYNALLGKAPLDVQADRTNTPESAAPTVESSPQPKTMTSTPPEADAEKTPHPKPRGIFGTFVDSLKTAGGSLGRSTVYILSGDVPTGELPQKENPSPEDEPKTSNQEDHLAETSENEQPIEESYREAEYSFINTHTPSIVQSTDPYIDVIDFDAEYANGNPAFSCSVDFEQTSAPRTSQNHEDPGATQFTPMEYSFINTDTKSIVEERPLLRDSVDFLRGYINGKPCFTCTFDTDVLSPMPEAQNNGSSSPVPDAPQNPETASTEQGKKPLARLLSRIKEALTSDWPRPTMPREEPRLNFGEGQESSFDPKEPATAPKRAWDQKTATAQPKKKLRPSLSSQVNRHGHAPKL